MVYPKISIITPSFNQGQHLEQTIVSVLSQEYPNLEYIVIDGGSTDNTVDIIKKYEKYLTYWVSEPDKGQSDAIDKGYNRATGEIINWLNSDDYYEPGALFKVGRVFNDPSVNIFCGISRVFGVGSEYYSNGTDIYPGNLEKTIGWARIDQPETFMRKRIWDQLGGIDIRFNYVMDKELWVRYLFTYGLAGVLKTTELLAHFRHHPGSKTMSQQGEFSDEGLSLFYSLAVENGLLEEAKFFIERYKTTYKALNYDTNFCDIKKIIDYFLYYQFLAAYANNDKKLMNYVKKFFNARHLSIEDRRKCREITLRSRLIPFAIKKLWNHL